MNENEDMLQRLCPHTALFHRYRSHWDVSLIVFHDIWTLSWHAEDWRRGLWPEERRDYIEWTVQIGPLWLSIGLSAGTR